MVEIHRFRAFFSEVQNLDMPTPGGAPLGAPNSLGLANLIVGLALRLALAVQFFAWARANAAPGGDVFDWRAWITPSPGLETAAGVWALGRVDAALVATALLITAILAALSFSLGLLTRITAALVALGACWHMLVVLPEAWAQTVAYVAIAIALILRGGGGASIDWILSRLSRFG